MSQHRGVPAQHDAVRIARIAQQPVERGRLLARGEQFGPRDDDGGDGVQLDRGARDQRGNVFHRAGQNRYAALLEDAGGAGESGDGVNTNPRRSGGGPLRGGHIIGAQNQYGYPDPGAMPRDRRFHELPHDPRMLHGRRCHQYDMPPPLQGRLCFVQRHTILGCQRARKWYLPGNRKATPS